MNNTLILIAMALLPTTGYASPTAEISLKGGLDSAALSKSYRVSRYGPAGGLTAGMEWPLVARLSLAGQLEVLYTPRGGEAVSEGVSQGKIQQHYLDVMFLARPRVRLDPMSIYLLLGGGTAFLVSAQDENAAGFPRDVTDDLHRIDVELLVGAGIALNLPSVQLGPFRSGAILFEVRHQRGLLDVDTMDFGLKNRTTSFFVGFSFVLGSGSDEQTGTTGTN